MSTDPEHRITVADSRHGIEPGMTIEFGCDPRARRLRALLTRPRKRVVTLVQGGCIGFVEHRMTWREWREALWAALRG